MRVGILTSWRVPCGVYQYSARLADALSEIEGVEPVVLAGRADEHRSIPEESLHEVHDVAEIGLWRDDGRYSLDAAFVSSLALDAVLVQYQSMLVREPDLVALRAAFDGPLAVTFHDNCQAPSFPHGAFDLKFTHRWDVGPADAVVIPFGIENRPPVVRTFGLGRTRSDLIAPICERNGWVFEDASSHEPIHGGGQQWRSHADLIAWLRGADAIVLWYDPQPMAGSSQAARTAMASRRPVVSNDTQWFSDLPRWSKQEFAAADYKQVGSLDELEAYLRSLFVRSSYVRENSWDRVAALLVEAFERVGATV